jgi:hypothetical protein
VERVTRLRGCSSPEQERAIDHPHFYHHSPKSRAEVLWQREQQ